MGVRRQRLALGEADHPEIGLGAFEEWLVLDPVAVLVGGVGESDDVDTRSLASREQV